MQLADHPLWFLGERVLFPFWRAWDSKLSIIKAHIWPWLLITGCLQYVDNLGVSPQRVKQGWNVLICFYPYLHSDLQDGLSMPL